MSDCRGWPGVHDRVAGLFPGIAEAEFRDAPLHEVVQISLARAHLDERRHLGKKFDRGLNGCADALCLARRLAAAHARDDGVGRLQALGVGRSA